MADEKIDLKGPDALRELMANFFETHDAEFTMAVQLSMSLDEMPIEDLLPRLAGENGCEGFR